MKINLNHMMHNNKFSRSENSSKTFSGTKTPTAQYLKYPNAENIRAAYMPSLSTTIPFKGHNYFDDILQPKFKNETLNTILSRNTDLSGLSTENAILRKEDDEITSSYLGEDGLKLMQAGLAHNTMYRMVASGGYDGVNFEEADNFFMAGIQRLVDNGIINDKTLVLIDTGHAIPMAAQLMDESNRASLGDVKGSFILGETSFPKGCPNAKSEEDFKTQEISRSCSSSRIASQALTYGDKISSAYKNNAEESGALFIGVDFHRQTKLDIAKLPTMEELKKLGIVKVVVAQEIPPVSSFSPSDAEKIYQPITQEQALRALNFMKRACTEAEKTPFGKAINEESKERIKKYLLKASDALKPRDIKKTYATLSKPDKKSVSKQIEKIKFGYSTKTTARGDISAYLRQLKKESKGSIDIILEGTDLMKLRSYPLDKVIDVKDKLTTGEAEGFKKTLNGDYLGANRF